MLTISTLFVIEKKTNKIDFKIGNYKSVMKYSYNGTSYSSKVTTLDLYLPKWIKAVLCKKKLQTYIMTASFVIYTKNVLSLFVYACMYIYVCRHVHI